MDKTICELFAGVGGFRLGMDRLGSGWNTVWFSQWEPGKKKQWAHDCYVKHFGDCADKNGEYHTCEDISIIDKDAIPDFNVLMGGFPCFTGDTRVLMADGSFKPICAVKVGEEISYKGMSYRVRNWWNQGKKTVIRLVMSDGFTVVCTPNHRFLCASDGEDEWVEAKDLLVDSDDGSFLRQLRQIRKNDGTTVYVDEVIKLADMQEVFDIEIDGVHCFVLENGVIAHNCQDYSVARSLLNAAGIEGKKGVLWWQIRDVVVAKKPAFCLFENVDRLLKSPVKQRGRDFGIMLATLNNLGYDVEWRVVNAAVYGGAQRRRRVFIFAYRHDTKYCKNMNAFVPKTVIDSVGFMAKAFPIKELEWQGAYVKLYSDLSEMSDNFSFKFLEAGFMRDGDVFTGEVIEDAEPSVNLGDILEPSVDEKYFLSDTAYDKYKYLKGAKRFERTAKTGYTYMYSEGPVTFPDVWDKPARTLLTGEGDISRTTHVVVDKETGRYRNLTPIETERLQGFDDDWTKETTIGEMSDNMRRFCMGNALVVPMITRMGRVLDKIVSEE